MGFRSSSRQTSISSASALSIYEDAPEDLLPASPRRDRESTVRGDPMTGKLLSGPDVVIERPRSRASSTSTRWQRRPDSSSSSATSASIGKPDSLPQLSVPDLDMLDIDELLAAVSGPPPSWPSPPAFLGLAPPWTPTEPIPHLSPPSLASADEDDFDPERTPRPPQGGMDATPRAKTDSDSPALPEITSFPSPPNRLSSRPRDSFFLASDEDEDAPDEIEDDVGSLASPLPSPTRSSGSGSRRSSRSAGSRSFRWSNSTTSTVLTCPSNRLSTETDKNSVPETPDPRLPYFQAYPLRHAERAVAPPLSRTASEPLTRTLAALRADEDADERAARRISAGEAPEWAALVDALYAAVVTEVAAPPPVPPKDASASPPASVRSTPGLRRKPSTASIASNHPPPVIGGRTTSLASPKRDRLPKMKEVEV